MDRELIDCLRDETNRRFDELRQDIKDLAAKLDGLQEFKIGTIVSTRWISLLVSAFCGLITLLVTVAVTVWATNKTVQTQPPQPKQGEQSNVGFFGSMGHSVSWRVRGK